MTNVSSKREVPNEILSREEEVKKDDASNDAAPSEDSRVDSPPTDCVPMEVVEIKPSAEAKSSSTSALVNNPMANVFTNPMLKTFDNPIAKAFDNPMTKAFDNSITKLAFPSFGNVEVIPIELNSKHAFTTLHEIGHLKASLESLKHLPQSLTTTTPPPQLTVLQQTVKTAKKSRDEEREKEVLKLKLDQLQSKLLEKDAEIAERIKNLDMKDGQVAELEQKVAELEAYEKERQQLKRLLTLHNRVNQIAQDHLRREGSALEKGYISALEEHVEAFVVSIDIRKSTELMLRAKQPELFAKFITELTGALRTAVTERFGVFDKFTGDGILAFFPYFFCGADAGLERFHFR